MILFCVPAYTPFQSIRSVHKNVCGGNYVKTLVMHKRIVLAGIDQTGLRRNTKVDRAQKAPTIHGASFLGPIVDKRG
jgi:hypothetical protein